MSINNLQSFEFINILTCTGRRIEKTTTKVAKFGIERPYGGVDELVRSIVSRHGAFLQKSSDILPRPLILLDKTR